MERSNDKLTTVQTSKIKTQLGLTNILWTVPLVLLIIFYFYPLLAILEKSLSNIKSAHDIVEIISKPYVIKTLWFTIWQATLSTILTLIVGLPGAYIFSHYNFFGKHLLRVLTTIPFVLPTVVVAASFEAILGTNGLLNTLLINYLNLGFSPIVLKHNLWSILIAHVFYNTTIILRLVGDHWQTIDPKIAQASYMLGANKLKSFSKITLPILTPSIISASLLTFIFNFTSFGVILILGGPTFSTIEVAIYRQTINFFDLNLAAILSIIQLFCTLFLTIVYTLISYRSTTMFKKNKLPIVSNKKINWHNKILIFIISILLVIFLVSPLLALAIKSIFTGQIHNEVLQHMRPSYTLNYYKELFINRRQSVLFTSPLETMIFSIRNAIITTIITLTIGIPTTWVLTRKSTLKKIVEPLLMLPLGTSSVTLGLGFLLVFSKPPLNLRTSTMILPLAHTLIAFPFVIRSLLPVWSQINPQIRQAASMLGANNLIVWFRIELPIIARSILVAGIFAFTISLGEFGATILLSRPEFTTIPMAIYRYLSLPGELNYGQAMALSTILMCVSGLSIFCIETIRPNTISEF